MAWLHTGLRDGGFHALGIAEMPDLTHTSHHAKQIMIEARLQDLKGYKIPLWRSSNKAWIWKGAKLVTQVVCDCLLCREKSAKMCEQWMGSFPKKRITPHTKPFTTIFLGLIGPTILKSMTNMRAHMKIWPFFFICQATGDLHTQVPTTTAGTGSFSSLITLSLFKTQPRRW